MTVPDPAMLSILISGLLLAIALPLWFAHRRRQLRQRTLSRMLDLADAVEALLDRSQERMAALRPLVQRVPADIAAEAQASLQSSLPIREAKRDVLQHRLWIQKHGDSASQDELDQACSALGRVEERLQQQLAALDDVGSDLASATQAAAEAALREPPALRRAPDA
jgi:hypothetical protein